MTPKAILAAAAITLAASTAATAGDVSSAGTSDQGIIVLPEMDAVPVGSLRGSGGMLVPALVGLLVIGAVASGGGS